MNSRISSHFACTNLYKAKICENLFPQNICIKYII